jgi:hypothetical protein
LILFGIYPSSFFKRNYLIQNEKCLLSGLSAGIIKKTACTSFDEKQEGLEGRLLYLKVWKGFGLTAHTAGGVIRRGKMAVRLGFCGRRGELRG